MLTDLKMPYAQEDQCAHVRVGCDESTQFRCLVTGSCIPASWECDGDPDCGAGDDSDEHPGCRDLPCLASQLTCDGYKCIPLSYRSELQTKVRENFTITGLLVESINLLSH